MNLPMIPPYLQPGPQRFIDGSNFASAGAGVLPETNFEVVYKLSFFHIEASYIAII